MWQALILKKEEEEEEKERNAWVEDSFYILNICSNNLRGSITQQKECRSLIQKSLGSIPSSATCAHCVTLASYSTFF